MNKKIQCHECKQELYKKNKLWRLLLGEEYYRKPTTVSFEELEEKHNNIILANKKQEEINKILKENLSDTLYVQIKSIGQEIEVLMLKAEGTNRRYKNGESLGGHLWAY